MSEGTIASTSSLNTTQNDKQDEATTSIGKRYGLKPHEQQAAQLAKLLANPEKPVHIPQSLQKEKTLRPPREIMKNVSGSSAGAGSGEFHVYKHSRRREFERIKLMEEAHQREKEKEVFLKRQKESQEAVEQKTNKNRAKRDKKKAARLAAKEGKKVEAKTNQDPQIDEEEDEESRSTGKRRRVNAEGASHIIFKPKDSPSDEKEDDEKEET